MFKLVPRTASELIGYLQNKRLSKGKKGIKKKVVDPFSSKGKLFVFILIAFVAVTHFVYQIGMTLKLLQSSR